MRALLALLFFATSVVAQSSIDPYEFSPKKDLRSADVNQLWRRLGISAMIRATGGNGSKDTSKSFRCDPEDQCEAELLWHHRSLLSSDADGEDEVVRVSPRNGYYDLN